MFLEALWSATGPHYWPTSKYGTIFRNFDPEKYGNKRWRAEFCSQFGSDVLFLVRSLIDVCAYWYKEPDEENFSKEYLTNKNFIRLANISHNLYLAGCEKDEEKPERLSNLTTTDDWEQYLWSVKTGYRAQERMAERPGQVMGICVLLMLDNVLTNIRTCGFDKANVNALLSVCRLQTESERTDDAIVDYHSARTRASEIAKAGGDGKAAKYKALEAETLRRYSAQDWPSVPAAALEITPHIVAMSKNGLGDLMPSTTKPLEWIRAYKRAQKNKPSA
jgi:hypothetical protein